MVLGLGIGVKGRGRGGGGIGEPFGDYEAFLALEMVFFVVQDVVEGAAHTAGVGIGLAVVEDCFVFEEDGGEGGAAVEADDVL